MMTIEIVVVGMEWNWKIVQNPKLVPSCYYQICYDSDCSLRFLMIGAGEYQQFDVDPTLPSEVILNLFHSTWKSVDVAAVPFVDVVPLVAVVDATAPLDQGTKSRSSLIAAAVIVDFQQSTGVATNRFAVVVVVAVAIVPYRKPRLHTPSRPRAHCYGTNHHPFDLVAAVVTTSFLVSYSTAVPSVPIHQRIDSECWYLAPTFVVVVGFATVDVDFAVG